MNNKIDVENGTAINSVQVVAMPYGTERVRRQDRSAQAVQNPVESLGLSEYLTSIEKAAKWVNKAVLTVLLSGLSLSTTSPG